MKTLIKTYLLGIFLIKFSLYAFAESNPKSYKKIVCKIEINKKLSHLLSIEIADTEEKRSHGLMNRDELKPNSGMLFIWKESRVRNFWMKNTFFDLDLFFLNKYGEIIEFHKNAKAFDKTNIKSRKKAMFVLEVKAGKHDFKLGNKLTCNF
ncbi:DUF192 domain-containing protein [Alphaproteobacteria bacterium]|nr:DUF192 domain-containing protein [Alphaproteobacteria bacterium]